MRQPLIADAQAPQHPQDALRDRGEREGVLGSRRDVHDAGLQRRVLVRGPDVPPDLRRVLDDAEVDQHGHRSLQLCPALVVGRQTRAGEVVEHRDAVRSETGVFALPERRGCRQREQMGQEVRHLSQQIVAQRVVSDADVHVAPADEQPSGDAGEVSFQAAIALLVGVVLGLPIRERMAGCRDRREPVAARMVRDGGAEPPQVIARRAHGSADDGADLHLALLVLGTDLILKIGAAVLEEALRRHPERLGVAVDEEVFLFDADGELRSLHRDPLPLPYLSAPDAARQGRAPDPTARRLEK